MKLVISFPVFCVAFQLTLLSYCVADDHQKKVLRRNKACPDGYAGINCKDDLDECKASPYPCAGGTKVGSFCVDYDPPQKYKCGCLPGYEAILPKASDVKDNVPIEWRPLKCVPKDACVGVVCHEDASCKVSTSNTAVCICNDNLVGDGITTCSPPPKTPPVKTPSFVCKSDLNCTMKLENSLCIAGVCTCKKGFYQSNGKGQCISENQCADGFPNDCHKNAICTNTEGGYFCTCMDGYHDLNTNVKPGTVCAQTNECLKPSMNNCNNETQVCLDRPPPKKWECVERTPAPTPVPFLCVNNKKGWSIDTGCTDSKPACIAEPGQGGYTCGICGCEYPTPFCVIAQGGAKSCEVCINNVNVGKDLGCTDATPSCLTRPGIGTYCTDE
jgi:Calcium-binding EGF domain